MFKHFRQGLNQNNAVQDKKLQTELNRKKQEVEKLKLEKDEAMMLLDYTRSKITVSVV